MEYNYLKIEKKRKWAIVYLARPKLNPLSPDVLRELEKCVLELKKDKGVSSIIIAGEGSTFSAGADVKVMKEFSPVDARSFAREGQRILQVIENLEKPVIAAIHGYAFGGGCELALSCDIRVATKDALIGQPELRLGLIPGFAGTQRLSRLIGIGRAKLMILTGEPVTGEEAYRIGLVEVLAEPNEHIKSAEKIAEKIAMMGPEAVRLVKTVLNRGIDSTFSTASSYEAESFGLVFSTGEPEEGIDAFLSKRSPKWAGE